MSLFSWSAPKEPNGHVTTYTVYFKEMDRAGKSATSHKVNARQTYHQVSNLDRKSRYEFWVTAHTDIGEGSSSSRVTSSPTERIPAKIASFDNKFTAVAKQEIRLPCMAGNVAAFLKYCLLSNSFVSRRHF